MSKARGHDERARLQRVQDEAQLVGPVRRRDGVEHGAQLDRGEGQDDPLVAVRKLAGHDVAGADPRNGRARGTSPGRATGRRGWALPMRARISSVIQARFSWACHMLSPPISSSPDGIVMPGHTTLSRTPNFPTSRAIDLESAITPALHAP